MIEELTAEPVVEIEEAEKASTLIPKTEPESSGVQYRVLGALYTLSELTPAFEGDKRGWKLPNGNFVSEETMRKSKVNVNRATKRDE